MAKSLASKISLKARESLPINSALKKRFKNLHPIFAKAAVGEFNSDVKISDKEDEFTEIEAGIQIMLEVIREKIEEAENLHKALREKVESKDKDVQQKEKILELVSYSAGALLMSEDWRKEADNMLRSLGRQLKADRIYLFKNSIKNKVVYTSQILEWTARGVSAQMDNPDLQDFSYKDAGFGRWLGILQHGGTINSLTKNMPKTEREFLESQDIRSILVVPIINSDGFWGFLGVDDCKKEVERTGSEVETLQLSARLIGAVVAKSEANQRLEVERHEAHKKAEELEKFNKLMIGREQKMAELKDRLKHLDTINKTKD